MTPKSARFSIFNRVSHEFLRAFNELVKDGCTKPELVNRLRELIKLTTKSLSKRCLLLLAAAISVSQMTDGTTIHIKSTFFELEISKIYLLAASAYLISTICIQLIYIFHYVVLENRISGNIPDGTRFGSLKKVFSGNAPDEYNAPDLLLPFRNGSLVTTEKFGTLSAIIVFALLFLMLGLPMVISLFIIVTETFLVFAASLSWSLEWALSISTICVLYCSSCYAIIYFTPMKIEKDLRYIRWNFLAPIANRSNPRHPQAQHWLK